MFRSLSARVVAALVLGLGAGAAIQAGDAAAWANAVSVVEALGALWLNALRMTVIPLIVSLLVTGIASVADAAATGRLATRAIALFTVLIAFAAAYSTLATQGLLSLWPIPPEAARAFIAGAPATDAAAITPPTIAQWLKSLAPANPVAAAAEDQITPLVVFAAFLGFAATRLPADLRTPLITFFRAVAEAMIVVVRWVLHAGPVGVFALSLGVGARAGLGAAGVLAQYVAIVSLVTIGIIVIAYALAVVWGRVPLPAYLRATAPATVVAFSTQSSLATLPAMLTASREGLGVPARIADVILPLAVAVFRFTSPVANLAVAYVIVHLYGIEPTPAQMLAAMLVAFAVSVGSVGLPGQVSFFISMAPICVALGAPIDLLGILLAVEVVPDIFRTVGNVMGDIAAVTILRRHEPPEVAPGEP
ncbi:MAG: cation:dicarboxylase symporter family transporter [Hyphomonadaceae bacterium]|nr:cation:dicarboxylase symporter family transporter [Hyphomonadaceae bacterium]